MSEDEFTKLFKYMRDKFTATRSEIAEVKKLPLETQKTIDSFAKQLLELTQEPMMLARKVDRMEDWIQESARKTGVKLKF